jgi:MFS family permease
MMGLVVAASYVFHGTIVDHLATKKGVRAAGIRYYIWLLAASVPLAATTFSVRGPLAFLGLLGILQIVALPFMLVMSASVISILPNSLRGRLTATFGFVMSVVGTAASPVIVGALTDYVFEDDQKIGLSLAIITSVGCAGSLVAFWCSLRPLVEVTIRRESGAA